MVSGNSISRRQKIILFYTLAILIPGIVLGYLAFRGILNDQALREKESRRELERISQNYFAAIDSSLVHFMKAVSTDSLPNSGNVQDEVLLVSYVKRNNQPLRIIHHQLLYLPENLLPDNPVPSAASGDLESGSRLEYNEQKLPEALRFYLGKIALTNVPAQKVEAMVAAARLYRKMGKPNEAKALYETIRQQYPGILFKRQMPLGLIAGLEILKINREQRDQRELKTNSLSFLELMLHPACPYDANQYDMFYRLFKEIRPETDHLTDSLLKRLVIRKARTDIVAGILEQQALITTGNREGYNLDKKGIFCSPVEANNINALLLNRFVSNGDQITVMIDFAFFLESKSEGLIQRLDPRGMVNLKVEDSNGLAILNMGSKAESGYLTIPFPDYLPSWRLLLKENQPGLITSLLTGGSVVYLLLFLLIVLLMVLGFIFSIYTLNEELRLNKLKSEFISNVSHELKSPLTAIRMMTEMLHHKRVESEERKATYYSVILEESEHLSQLIDNILDFSRIEEDRKKYNFEKLDLDLLLCEFSKSTRDRLTNTDFEIRYNCQESVPLVLADKNALLQVINNLVDNAIKFSGNSKLVEIQLTSNENEVQFSVTDDGIGIPIKDQEKIFNRFYRCDEPQKLGIKGSGIGLTIVKKIVEAHNGRLMLNSEPGKGSTFSISLPLDGGSG